MKRQNAKPQRKNQRVQQFVILSETKKLKILSRRFTPSYDQILRLRLRMTEKSSYQVEIAENPGAPGEYFLQNKANLLVLRTA